MVSSVLGADAMMSAAPVRLLLNVPLAFFVSERIVGRVDMLLALVLVSVLIRTRDALYMRYT